jgi:hypothetical protein
MEKEVGRSGAEAPSGCEASPSAAIFVASSRSRIPNADRRDLEAISAWPERRPPRTEEERGAIADRFAAHLPKKPNPGVIGEEDILAMRAAFIRRFDEQLPRTETLMAVAHIGYRMALRDLASCDTHPKGGDVQRAPCPMSGAVGAAETPNPHDQNTREASDE